MRRVSSAPAILSFEDELMEFYSAQSEFEDLVEDQEVVQEFYSAQSEFEDLVEDQEVVQEPTLRRVRSSQPTFAYEDEQDQFYTPEFEDVDENRQVARQTARRVEEIEEIPQDNEDTNGGTQARTPLDEESAQPGHNEEMTRSTQLKRMNHIYPCFLVSVLSGLTVGYLNALPGQLLGLNGFVQKVSPRLFKKKVHAENDLFCSFIDRGLIAVLGLSALVQLCGVVGAKTMSKRVGRKKTLFVSLLITLVAIVMVIWLPNTTIFLVGFGIINVGIGGISKIVPIIQSELFPDWWKNIYDIATNFGGGLAILVVFKVSNYQSWAWRAGYGVAGIIIFSILFIAIFLSESPIYMVEKGKKEIAKRIMHDFQRKEDVDDILEKAEVKVERMRKTSAFVVFASLSRPSLLVMFTSTLTAFFSVVGVLQFYGPILLMSINVIPNAQYKIPALISGIQIVFRVLSLIVSQRYGRRYLLLVAVLCKCISETYLAAVFSLTALRLSFFHHPWHMLIPGAVNVAADACLTAPGVWLETSFPDESSETGDMVAATFDKLQSAITASFSVVAFCNLSRFIFYPYIAVDFLIFIIILIFLPETTNMDMVKAFSSHWFWKKFVKESDTYEFV